MSQSLGLIDSEGRLTAWELIVLNEITSLPVNPFVIAAKNAIQVLTYQQLAEITGNTVDFYEKEYNPIAFSYQLNGHYCIAYKSVHHPDMDKLRVDIMHELCHIFLQHPVEDGSNIKHDKEKAKAAELEANKLLRRTLAPSIVLHMCGCDTPEEIAALCGIPLELADQRYEHLQDLRHRDAFLRIETEHKMLNNFMDFICSYLVRKHK